MLQCAPRVPSACNLVAQQNHRFSGAQHGGPGPDFSGRAAGELIESIVVGQTGLSVREDSDRRALRHRNRDSSPQYDCAHPAAQWSRPRRYLPAPGLCVSHSLNSPAISGFRRFVLRRRANSGSWISNLLCRFIRSIGLVPEGYLCVSGSLTNSGLLRQILLLMFLPTSDRSSEVHHHVLEGSRGSLGACVGLCDVYSLHRLPRFWTQHL